MKRVLVTGAGGFAGGYLCAALRHRGLEVFGVDRGARESTDASVDMTDGAGIEALIERTVPDAVFHLAALSSAGKSYADPRPVLEVNGMGTFNLLEALRRQAPAARLVSVASGEIYGPSQPGEAHGEDAPLAPVSPYGASKAWQDVLTAQYGRAYNLDTVRIRPFNHTGPGQHSAYALSSFASQIAAIERGESEPRLQVGNLEPIRDFLDVRDVVECYCEILLRSERGSVWNVCSGRGRSMRELLELLLAQARVPIAVVEGAGLRRSTDVPCLVGNPQRVRQAFGFEPSLTMEQTLTDLLDGARSIPE